MYKVLIVSNVWPEPTSSAGGARAAQIIKLFRALNWQVTLGVTAQPSEHSIDCEAVGVHTQQIAMNDSTFDLWVYELNPDIVIFDRFMCEEQFAWRVAEQCPQAVRIIDSIDVHFLRRARQHQLHNESALNLLTTDALRELAAYYRSDLTLILSEFEMKLLQDDLDIPHNILHYLPFMIAAEGLQPRSNPDFAARQHFMMIGNFLHQPNWDAVQWAYKEIWPLIRKELPQAELHVYGAYASDKHMQLHKPDQGFHVKGRAEDAVPCLRNYRLNLAPLRFGAGIKGKITDGFLAGTPCIATSIAAEAMHADLPWAGLIADNAHDYAQAAITLYAQQEHWQQCQKNGYEIIRQRFSTHKHADVFVQRIQDIKNNLEQHRQKNVVGAILQHHSLKSTKYMSQWIEQKNINKKSHKEDNGESNE